MRQLVTSLVLSRIDYRSRWSACVDHCSTPARRTERRCTSCLTTGPSVTQYIQLFMSSTAWLATGEVPHPVQNSGVHIPSHRSTMSVVRCWPRRLLDPQRRSLRSTSTRAAVIQRTRTDFGRSAFDVCGTGVWNSLPPSLYAPWPLILHFIERWRLSFITLHFLILLLLPAVLTI